ncbi:MAG: LCP family protein [Candidatus Saccharimonadales bacterium]
MKDTSGYDKNRPRQSIDGVFNYRSHTAPPSRIVSEYAKKPQIRPFANSAQLRSAPGRIPISQLKSRPDPLESKLEDSSLGGPVSLQEMRLPGDGGHQPVHHRIRSIKKWTFRTATALAVVVLLIGGFLFSKGYLQLHRVFTGGSSAAALNAEVNPDQLKGEGSGRVNILLLGIGGPGHDGPDLTDTMMIASIDVVNHRIGLLSIPRDLWIKEPNNFVENYGKINAAYESGKYRYLGHDDSSNGNINAIKAGFKTVDQTMSRIAGIPINYNALVNFQAFQQAVDAVGGVTINVPTELYDPTMAWQNNWNPVLAKKGVQYMDGYQALLYARSRETTSDFARTDRQRALLLALESKVLTAGTLSDPLKISNLLSAFGDNVRTDISLSDMQQLYNIISKIPSSSVKSVDMDTTPNNLVTTGDIDGQSIVEPKAGLFDYSAIQSFVRNTLRDGYLAKENALVKVLNGTSVPGLATQETNTLQSYGYRMAAPADAPSTSYATTTLIDLTHGKDKYTLHYLERRLNVKATVNLPPGMSAGGANFVIILGQDEAASA